MTSNNYKISPKKLAEYCKGRVCQNKCKYNKICWYNFRLDRPEDAYSQNKNSDEYKKLKCMVKMINMGIENDINKIVEREYLWK